MIDATDRRNRRGTPQTPKSGRCTPKLSAANLCASETSDTVDPKMWPNEQIEE